MKKLITSILVFISLIGISYAQPGSQGQRMSPEQREEMLAQRLGLDDSQKEQVSAINEKYREQTVGLREQIRATEDQEERQALMTKMKDSRKEQSTEIKALLNPDQVVKYEEMQKRMEEMRQNWQDKRKDRNSNPRNGSVRPGK